MIEERRSKVDFDVIADRYDLWYENAEGAMYDRLEKIKMFQTHHLR